MASRISRVVLSVTAVVLILGGLYCVLWIFSSASLAFTACDGKYSLFAESLRCRQPYIAMLLALVLFTLAGVTLFFGFRKDRQAKVVP